MRFRNQIILFAICGLFLLSATSCVNLTAHEKAYYMDIDNYITVTGVVEYIKFDDDYKTLYLGFSEMSVELDDNCFKIVDKNYLVVLDNNAENKLEIGKTVTFITAPKYFGDGYVMPIVELAVDNEIILDFETGYRNLLDWLNN